VDIGAELFVWSCTLAYAETRITDASVNQADVEKLLRKVHYFGDLSRKRLANHYAAMRGGLDKESYRVSRDLVES
jgi:hypothetical protein